MTNKKVWLVSGVGRGMGVEITKAALGGGFKVIATGRNIDKVTKVLGRSENLLVVKLDITSTADAEAAVKAAVDKLGSIDVLVNNAANFMARFFEELTPEPINQQLLTSLIGPMNVTRAVLPVMRKQGSGQIIKISSEKQPPRRFIAGADAIGLAEQVVQKLQKETDAYRDLSSSLAY